MILIGCGNEGVLTSYTAKVIVQDRAGNKSESSFTGTEEIFVANFAYTGAVQSITIPKDGTYTLEVWGAQGGTNTYQSWVGGKGGYSVGTVSLTSGATIYVYVGGKGTDSGNTVGLKAGGFNGGGSTYNRNTSGDQSAAGGGGTDMRINSTSLYARVIVAGGGGGAAEDSSGTIGGAGGGSSGVVVNSGTAGGQTGDLQFFGKAPNGLGEGGAGGGGWYGGVCLNWTWDTPTSNTTEQNGGAPGGSGYVYTSSTASKYPSGCLLNSSYYLSNAQTIAGDTSFPSTSGGTETGHSGNGYARITLVE